MYGPGLDRQWESANPRRIPPVTVNNTSKDSDFRARKAKFPGSRRLSEMER
jgi:hypothetical protein